MAGNHRKKRTRWGRKKLNMFFTSWAFTYLSATQFSTIKATHSALNTSNVQSTVTHIILTATLWSTRYLIWQITWNSESPVLGVMAHLGGYVPGAEDAAISTSLFTCPFSFNFETLDSPGPSVLHWSHAIAVLCWEQKNYKGLFMVHFIYLPLALIFLLSNCFKQFKP